MNSICSIIENYIDLYKQKSDIEKSFNINDSFKRIKKQQIINITNGLDVLDNMFSERLNDLDNNGFEKIIRIIESNISKIEKDSSDYKVSLDAYSKKNIDFNINAKESMTYVTNTTNKYLAIEALNNKLKIYRKFLLKINEYRSQKIYHKAV